MALPAQNASLAQSGRKPMATVYRPENSHYSLPKLPRISDTPEGIAEFGKWLYAEMELLGLKQKQLEKLSGVPQTAISEYLNGIAPNADKVPFLVGGIARRYAQVFRRAADLWEGCA